MRAPLLPLPAAAALPLVAADIPTSYIDIHQITSFKEGSFERGFLFRISASESNFAGHPPKGPRWATHSALTGGAGTEPDHLKHTSTQFPSYRLMLPPDVDDLLCNEAKGAADYKNPAGNAASGVFDPDTNLSGYERNYILVPRGHCTFEAKARSAQRLGAAGVIVRNTLDSRYGLKDEDAPSSANNGGPDWSNTKWPEEREDYECGTHKAANRVGWRAEIDAASLGFSPAPYDGSVNNALLTGPAADGSLCAAQPNLDFAARCPSERCLLTGRNATDDGSKLEACCAWDLYERMGANGHNDGDAVPEDEEEPITIAALFVTMENGEELYDIVLDAAAQTGDSVRLVTIVPYQRWYPSGHYSSIIVWALALFALWIASYESAKEYRTSWKKIKWAVADGVLIFRSAPSNGNNAANRRRRVETVDTVDFPEENVDLELSPEVELANRNAAASSAGSSNAENGVTATPDDGNFTISDDGADMDDFVGNDTSYNRGAPSSASVLPEEEPHAPDTDAPPQQRQPQRVDVQSTSTNAAVQNLEINALHAVLFVVCASCFLFILFFFKIDKVIRVLYGLGGSAAMNQIIFYPMYVKILSSKFVPEGVSATFRTNAFGNLPGCRGEYFRWIDVLSAATSFAIGIAWIVVGLTRVQPMTNFYYWFFQDVMGVCFCILVLGVIHINTIMVASVLLFLVFVYDVFHVLISPLIFGSSVMVDVATGSSRVDPQFCEKYPSDKACRGAFAPLPMLFAVPWFNDFRGGFSMLGLGDIILPGLLISFAARYDAAIALVRNCTQASSNQSGETAANAEIDTVGQVDSEPGADGTSRKRYHYQLGRIQMALFRGYFGPLMIAYGVGLMIAYLIVWSTTSVQPALLYLVPTCLGTTSYLGWRRRELSELWSGPKVMRKADRMVGLAGKIPEPRPTAGTSGVSTSLPASSTMV